MATPQPGTLTRPRLIEVALPIREISAESGLGDHACFWRLTQALFEVLPRDGEDWNLVSALLGERNTLRTEIKRREAALSGSAPTSLFREQQE
jgi:hypothetical protein